MGQKGASGMPTNPENGGKEDICVLVTDCLPRAPPTEHIRGSSLAPTTQLDFSPAPHRLTI